MEHNSTNGDCSYLKNGRFTKFLWQTAMCCFLFALYLIQPAVAQTKPSDSTQWSGCKKCCSQSCDYWCQQPSFGCSCAVGFTGGVSFVIGNTAYVGTGVDANGDYLEDF